MVQDFARDRCKFVAHGCKLFSMQSRDIDAQAAGICGVSATILYLASDQKHGF
jgi:hypothetical protein